MRTITSLVVSLASVGVPLSVSAMELSYYQEAMKAQPGMTQMYVVGIGQGYSWSNSIAEKNSGKKLYCQPTDVSLTGADYLSILDKAIEDGNFKPSHSVAFILYAGLLASFPCSDSGE